MINTYNLIVLFHDRLPREFHNISRSALAYYKSYYNASGNVNCFVVETNR